MKKSEAEKTFDMLSKLGDNALLALDILIQSEKMKRNLEKLSGMNMKKSKDKHED